MIKGIKASNRNGITAAAALAASVLTPALTAADYSGQNLDGANMTNGYYSSDIYNNSSLVDANLSGSTFSSPKFIGADLTNATAVGTKFTYGDFTGAKFISANLTSADIQSATLVNADFTSANFTGAKIYYSNLSNAIFDDADITGLNLSSPTNFVFSQFETTKNFKNKSLSNIFFNGTSSNKISLGGASLKDFNLSGITLQYVDVSGVDFSGANISGSAENITWFTSLTGLTAAQLQSTASYQNGAITRFRFAYLTLSGVSFKNFNMQGTGLQNSTFTDCDFSGTDFRGGVINGNTYNGTTNFRNYIDYLGWVKNTSFESADDYLLIRKHSIQADLYNGISIKNGAMVEIDSGAVLGGYTSSNAITVDDGGILKINIGADGAGVLDITAGNVLSFLEGSELVFDLTDFDPLEVYDVIKFSNADKIVGLDIADIRVTVDGIDVADDSWSLNLTDDALVFSFTGQIPEPAETACLIGLLALGYGIYRKKKNA